MYPGTWLSEQAGEKAAGTPESGKSTTHQLQLCSVPLTDNETVALELAGQADFVAWGALHELDIGDAVAHLDKGRDGGVEFLGLSCRSADGGRL